MAREQLRALKSINPDLFSKITKSIRANYPEGEGWRRTFAIGSMATIRAF